MDTPQAWKVLEKVRDSDLREPAPNMHEALALALLGLRDVVNGIGDTIDDMRAGRR